MAEILISRVNELKVQFFVEGKPPRKDGSSSMWNKDEEANRLVRGKVTIWRIELYWPIHDIERMGDLDNFITGICDGRQAVHPKASLHTVFSLPENELIHPRNSLLLKDDSCFIEIVARKRIHPGGVMNILYAVSLESLSECY